MNNLNEQTLKDFISGHGYGVAPAAVEAMASELLALREARREPVGFATKRNGNMGSWLFPTKSMAENHDSTALGGKPALSEILPLYAAQQLPAVLDAVEDNVDSDDHPLLWSYNNGWNACRKAMMDGTLIDEGTKLPAAHDDTRRMDWLCSMVVDVREPLVYGSHSVFWSQRVSDDDEPHHTTLREQIDAAIAAAPKPEVSGE